MRERTTVIIDETNPGALSSGVQDLTIDLGYCLHYVVTNTLTFTSEIWAGNLEDPTKMVLLTGASVVVDNTGYINNTSFAQYRYFQVRLSGVSGSGSVQCILTVKEY